MPNASDVTIAAESPLLRLFQRRGAGGKSYIDISQFAAGEKLRTDFERAHLAPRVVSSYAESAGSGGRHWQMSDNGIERMSLCAIEARDRIRLAFEAGGPELSGILYQVCCLASGFEAAEAALNLPQRCAKAVLALGLTRLARHYGLIRVHKPRQREVIAHWAMDNYRPSIPVEVASHTAPNKQVG